MNKIWTNVWMAYAVSWIATSAAVCCGIYITHSAWCLWALFIPGMIEIKLPKNKADNQNESEKGSAAGRR